MIPKNSDLFTGLTKLEALFIRPDEYPWMALVRLVAFMTECKEGYRRWPRLLFPEDERGARKARSVRPFGGIHVRGCKDIHNDEETLLLGPVFVGKGVTLRKGAVVTGPAWIGDGAVIGQGCRIKHSIILPKAEIVFGTRLKASLIGRGVRIGSGVVSETLPCRGGTIRYREENGQRFHGDEVESIDTQLPELGLFAGDNSFIGGGTIASPGVILKPNTRVQEGSRLRGQRVFEDVVES
jgi:NDP-sugar pyrophosphorylase family protein